MSRCELCNNFGPAKIKYDLDTARKNAKAHFLQLSIVDDQVSADKIFEKCFPVFPSTAARRGNKHAKCLSRQILLHLCHSLFPRKHVLESLPNITCAKCGVECKIQQKEKRLNTRAIIDHACTHLDDGELYACRHCSRSYKTCGAIRWHLTTVHRIDTPGGHFEDNSHNFVKEISHLIENCFGQNTNNEDNDRRWARTASNIRRQHKGSALSIERQLLCHQLITKIADRDRSIQCRLCSTCLSVKAKNGFSSEPAMQHLLLHMQKPTMQCRIYSEAFVCRSKLKDHVRNVHSVPLANNYDCLADEFHTEILAFLENCYGTKADGNRKPMEMQLEIQSRKFHLLCISNLS